MLCCLYYFGGEEKMRKQIRQLTQRAIVPRLWPLFGVCPGKLERSERNA